MKEVAAAIIKKNGEVLIAQRTGDELAGKWEFPGGKLEVGETPQECLKREIKEELDVIIDVQNFFGESIYEYDKGTIKLLAFWCKWTSGAFSVKVHSQIKWVKLIDLNQHEFAPADVPLVEKLVKSCSIDYN